MIPINVLHNKEANAICENHFNRILQDATKDYMLGLNINIPLSDAYETYKDILPKSLSDERVIALDRVIEKICSDTPYILTEDEQDMAFACIKYANDTSKISYLKIQDPDARMKVILALSDEAALAPDIFCKHPSRISAYITEHLALVENTDAFSENYKKLISEEMEQTETLER